MLLGKRRRSSVLTNTNYIHGRLPIDVALNVKTYNDYLMESRPLNQNLDQGRSNYIQFGGEEAR
jgi:hypothetical protein